ncbi:tRNA lysidine(34) synthetase TilS [Rhizobium rhizosphaerae]|uniref:tRNA(Ile)-lysidine synthase n=1 Tax=Xaviernesmea rhizosphaerae TaxID=1672749 RepID=A0A1Q9AF71_9HYPH|nr:tRNA lysidine(34) synthetase TilS [Xaviernesmea rhizosphaerae]OLP53622.1 tRNA lysidine(34) synthetase TilS [Xaviernesmea rhizosphaerae]
MSDPVVSDAPAGDPVIAAAHCFLSSLSRPSRLLVALSGGSDSMGLLRALHAALPDYPGVTIEACTVDHGLRGESAEEARQMGALCRRLGIRHHTRLWEGVKPASGLQAAARLARYRLLADIAAAQDIPIILSGHTADDQAETVAMRRLRSTPDQPGLSGMAPATLLFGQVWLLRPFLSLRRAQIRWFLQAIGQDFIEDPSNDNPRFERVRLRQARAGADPLAHAADMAAIERAGAARLAEDVAIATLLAAHARRIGEGRVGQWIVRLSPELLLPESLQLHGPALSRACGLLAAALGGRTTVSGRDTLARLMAFLDDQTPGRMTAAGTVFDRRRQGLYLYREARGLTGAILAPGATLLWDGRLSVTSQADHPLILSAGLQGLIVADVDVPPGVVARAARAQLRVSRRSGEPADPASWQAEPCLGLYDTFLPCFDLRIASEIARLVGRKPFPELPQSLSLRMSKPAEMA